MGNLEQWRADQPDVPRPGTHPGSGANAAAPIDYTDDPVASPVLANLPDGLQFAVDQARGSPVDASWGSYTAPPLTRRARADGQLYVHRTAWCVGPSGVTLINARRDARREAGVIRPYGPWRAQVDHRPASDPEVAVRREQAPATPVLDERKTTTAGRQTPAPSGPYSRGYGGREPDVWMNLPLRVRHLIEHAVPIDRADTERADSRLWWGGAGPTRESLWYERATARLLVGTEATRTSSVASSPHKAAAVRSLAGRPWTFVVARVQLAPAPGHPAIDAPH